MYNYFDKNNIAVSYFKIINSDEIVIKVKSHVEE